jgi:hypothetical protein
MKKIFLVSVMILLSSCFSEHKNTGSQAGWNIWEGRGNITVNENILLYEPVSFQDEEYDSDIEGRGPAAIAAKLIKGKKWTLDFRPVFLSNSHVFNRFTVGLWSGQKGKRPSLASKDARMTFALSKTRGPGPDDTILKITLKKGDVSQNIELPGNARFFRFQREGSIVKFFYSTGYRPNFTEALSFTLDTDDPVYFTAGARYDGKISGKPVMKLIQLTLDGKNFL